jgi:vancomycin permeability regulator SanA
MKSKLLTAFLVPMLWFLIHTGVIVVDGLRDEPEKSDVGVIFGNTVHADGTLSSRLKARLDKGLELYRDSLVRMLMVSGGLGKEGHYEGTKMAEYLISMGVPEVDILVDDVGINTWATAQNLNSSGISVPSVKVISQYHHISRAKLALRKNGFHQVSGASPRYFEWRDFYSVVREFLGYYSYLLK